MQACKPGSVPFFNRRKLIIYLAQMLPSESSSLPNPDGLPKQSFERAVLDRGLFGLSTRKVCHASEITFSTGGLLLHLFTFSLPVTVRVVYFLWHFL